MSPPALSAEPVPTEAASRALQESADACLAPARMACEPGPSVEPARSQTLESGLAATVAPAAAATPSEPTLGQLGTEALLLQFSITMLELQVTDVAVDVVRVAGRTMVRHPQDFGRGFLHGFWGSFVDTFVQPIKLLSAATVWLAKLAGCGMANDLRAYFQAETGVELFTGDACAPFNAVMEDIRREAHSLEAMAAAMLAEAEEHPLRLLSDLLLDATLAMQVLAALMDGPGRDALKKRADDATAVGTLLGDVVMQVLLTLAPVGLARVAKVLTVVRLEVEVEVTTQSLTKAAVAAAEEQAALVEKLTGGTEGLGRVIKRTPKISGPRVEAVRGLARPLVESSAALRVLIRVRGQALLGKVGIFAKLDAIKRDFNAQALLAMLIDAVALERPLTAQDEMRLTAKLTEEVFENAHIVDKRFYARFKDGFVALLADEPGAGGSAEHMRSFLALASDHTRSPLRYFRKFTGWELTAEDIGGKAESITQVFLRRIVNEGEGKAAKGIFVVTKDTKLSELHRMHLTVWQEEFPGYFKFIKETLEKDIAKLESLGR
jgi:hypothetical protein